MKWDEMNPHERDALLAEKVMGWNRNGVGGSWSDENGRIKTLEPTSFGSFQPSTDISAAWEVVDKMLERDYWISDLSADKLFDGTSDYTVRYYHSNPDSLGDFVGEVTCATASEAICKAALKAMGVEIE